LERFDENGGLVDTAASLGRTRITKIFLDEASRMTVGMTWAMAFAVLSLICFYARSFFASIYFGTGFGNLGDW
jgi:hypothetical protein